MHNAETKIILDAISTMPPESKRLIRKAMLDVPAELSHSERVRVAGSIICAIVGEAFVEIFSSLPKSKQVLAASVCVSLCANAMKERVDWSSIGLWVLTNSEEN